MAKWTMSKALADRVWKTMNKAAIDSSGGRMLHIDDFLGACRTHDIASIRGPEEILTYWAEDATDTSDESKRRAIVWSLMVLAKSAISEMRDERQKTRSIRSALNSIGLMDREDVEEMMED